MNANKDRQRRFSVWRSAFGFTAKEVLTMSSFKKTMYAAFRENNTISPAYFDKYSVKRGLRNPDGTGVMAGVTNICNVHGYVVDDGEKKPAEGKLIFRGYSIRDLIGKVEAEDRFGFEEIVYLLLTGKLPTMDELAEFTALLSDNRALPENFFEDMILKAPSRDIMNKMNARHHDMRL